MYSSILWLVAIAAIAAPSVCGAEIPEADVRQVKAKLVFANCYLEITWREFFPNQAPAIPVPRLVAYRGQVASGCGTLGPQNGHFCGADNTIYYDEVFLTSLAKAADRALRTAGDYAAIAVLAHEWGHAVRYWQDAEACRKARGTIAASLFSPGPTCPGNIFESGYSLEAQADCFAGAVTKHVRDDRLLEPGDFEEALFAMGSGGDTLLTPGITPPISNPVYPKGTFVVWSNSLYSHGTGPARRKHFELGYARGAVACEDALQIVR